MDEYMDVREKLVEFLFEEKIVWHEITTRRLTEEEKAEYDESR